nr:nitroreductase family protein [uncultured Sellimonas sp.]
MNCSDVIRERRSIRKYKEDVVIPRKDFEKMLEAAMMAPSARNTRPWEFFVITKREVLNQLMEAHPFTSMLKSASAAIVVCGRPDLQEGKCGAYWPQDCGAAIENLLLQAKDLGYGTCWCGCYPAMDRVEKIQTVLNTTSIPVSIVAVGEADESPSPRGFFDPDRVTYIQ